MDKEVREYLADKYPHFTPAQLDMISVEAYDRGHSAGQDEVNNYARSIAIFVDDILKAA